MGSSDVESDYTLIAAGKGKRNALTGHGARGEPSCADDGELELDGVVSKVLCVDWVFGGARHIRIRLCCCVD